MSLAGAKAAWTRWRQSRREAAIVVSKAQRRLVYLVGVALLINHFDANILALALPQIQKSLAIPESQLGVLVGISRLGVLGAFVLGFAADVVGRRAVLMWTIVGATAATLLTALVQNPYQYFGLQTLIRAFAYAEEIICFVVIAEEMAANRRGWAMGRLSALGSLGTGLAAVLYGKFGGTPEGWRTLYVVGGCGLILIVVARRALKETARFEAVLAGRDAKTKRSSTLEPFLKLLRESPGRFAALAGTTIPYVFGMAAALALVSKRLQEGLGFSPAQMGTLFIVGGAFSYLAYFHGGAFFDRIGRKRMLLVSMPGSALLYGVLYLTPVPAVGVAAWVFGLFLMFASEMSLSMIGSELFPTTQRATASAARVVLSVVGGAAGLGVESLLYGVFGTHVVAVCALLCVTPLALLAVAWLPETAHKELEDI